MKKLAEHILKHLTIDFEDEGETEEILEELVGDSELGRRFLQKIEEEGGFEEFIFVFVELLREDYLQEGVTTEVIEKELKEYAESD